MNSFQVTCVTKPHRSSSYEHITHIGNPAQKWRLTREAAIQKIDSGAEAFYTVDYYTGRHVPILVVRESGKMPHLRTYADGKWGDNLLALSECGAECALVG